MDHSSTVRTLKELITALDRRVPQIHREGEAAIARDAAALRARALLRITELERESQKSSQTQLFIETPYRNAALFDALLAACRPHTLLCVASDLSLPTETLATRRIADWRKTQRPDLDKRPTVFLILSAG